jgi:7-alpha-hydroxysteroid dehydrogenase
MTRSMAVALAPHRIRVNAVAFGSVMSASLKLHAQGQPDYREDIEDHTPLGRIAGPANWPRRCSSWPPKARAS